MQRPMLGGKRNHKRSENESHVREMRVWKTDLGSWWEKVQAVNEMRENLTAQ